MKIHIILLDRGYRRLRSYDGSTPPAQNTTIVIPSSNAWNSFRVQEVITLYPVEAEHLDVFVIVVPHSNAQEATRRVTALYQASQP